MIHFENVDKFIISKLSIHIPQGKAVGLIGVGGAGKTTFLKLACGLLAPDRGFVSTMGLYPVDRRKKLAENMGALFADIPYLTGEDTIWDNFKFLQKIYRISNEDFIRDYTEISKRLGFADFQNCQVKELSLGQRRRAEIGAVLLSKPKLLLLDEPTEGLDENGKQVFHEMLAERKKEGVTLVISSHNMAEISKVCDRIALIDMGTCVYYGSEEQLRKKIAPIDTMCFELDGKIPDFQDLPIMKYTLDGVKVSLSYNANYVTAAEILELILSQTVVKEVKIHKSDLPDVMIQMSKERKKNE